MMKVALSSLVLTIAAILIPGQDARAHGAHYRGHHGPGFVAYGPRYRYRHAYRHAHGYYRYDRYRYLAAGLVLGAVANAALQPRPVVTRTRTVYRTRAPEARSAPPPAAEHRSAPVAPIERPAVYLRRDADGSCWLVEGRDDGSEIITPQDPGVCG